MIKSILISILLLVAINSFAQAQFDTTQCNFEIVDTLKYTIDKSNTPTAISINTINEANTSATDDGYDAFGQLFEAPDTVNLKGFCFYGFIFSGTPDSVLSRVYQTTPTGELDSLVDSMWIPVPLKANYSGNLYSDSIKICAMFNTPHQLIGDYVITLTNNSTSDMYIVRNNDGQSEDLAYTYYYWDSNHTYDGWFKTYGFGAGWDFDIIIEPIVSYFLTTQHITNQNSNCLGDTLTISSSIDYNDSLLSNRMYNPDYNTYISAHNFIYNYGDNTTTSDTSHNYLYPGAYNLLFNGVTTMSGWTFNQYNAICSYSINILDIQIDLGADTSLCVDSIRLTAGQYFEGYLWNTMDTTDMITIYADSLSDGIYQYSVRTEYNGCYSYDTIDITVGSMQVNLGNDTTLCMNQQLELSTGVNGNHNWNTGQLTNTITVGPFNTPDSLTYIVEVDAAGCLGTDTVLVVIDNCLGADNQLEDYISIFPNPVKEQLTIENSIWENYTIQIMDLTGKIIFEKGGHTYTNTINLSALSNGTYLLTLLKDNQKYHQKIQIIK